MIFFSLKGEETRKAVFLTSKWQHQGLSWVCDMHAGATPTSQDHVYYDLFRVERADTAVSSRKMSSSPQQLTLFYQDGLWVLMPTLIAKGNMITKSTGFSVSHSFENYLTTLSMYAWPNNQAHGLPDTKLVIINPSLIHTEKHTKFICQIPFRLIPCFDTHCKRLGLDFIRHEYYLPEHLLDHKN